MQKFSALSLFRGGLDGHAKWQRQWRSPEPKPHYDVVIIGGGGHGLATAYYLAERFGISNVAVVESGWLRCGNTRRNTTNIRAHNQYVEIARNYGPALDFRGYRTVAY